MEHLLEEVSRLQEISLAQEILEELKLRDIHEIEAATTLIEVCKGATDEESFSREVFARGIKISDNFANSLYDTIRQKLPRHHEIAQLQQVESKPKQQ